jgi:AcrR family transcriptional regulator
VAAPPRAGQAAKSRPSAAPARIRVPNVERSAATRAKLLKATIDCLYEVGYHQTSTVLVTERAKVSRGSMLHHFPTKADLMMATSEYIVGLRRDLHRARITKLAT